MSHTIPFTPRGSKHKRGVLAQKHAHARRARRTLAARNRHACTRTACHRVACSNMHAIDTDMQFSCHSTSSSPYSSASSNSFCIFWKLVQHRKDRPFKFEHERVSSRFSEHESRVVRLTSPAPPSIPFGIIFLEHSTSHPYKHTHTITHTTRKWTRRVPVHAMCRSPGRRAARRRGGHDW